MPEIYKRHCDNCGRYYEGQGDKFCSKKCYGAYGITEATRLKLKEKRKGKTPTLGHHQSEEWILNHKKMMREYYTTHPGASAGKLGEASFHWKGGRTKESQGYIRIMLSPDDFFYSMAQKNGYVKEHRLVVAKALGRCLHSWEIVHHKHDKYPAGSSEDKQDNRYPENLQLVTDDRHKQITILENKIKRLEKRVFELEVENAIFQKEVSSVEN